MPTPKRAAPTPAETAGSRALIARLIGASPPVMTPPQPPSPVPNPTARHRAKRG